MKRLFFLIAISLLCAVYTQAQEITRLPLSTEAKDPVGDKAAATGGGGCKLISTLKNLKVEKNKNAEYICTLTDTADNPLRSFKLTQFNEQLFNDKFQSAVYGICNGVALSKNDSTAIDAFYKKVLKSQNLYQRMLEASLEVNDDEVLAGILRVTKAVPVTIKIYKKDTTNKNNPSVTTVTNGRKKLKDGTWADTLIIHDIQAQFQDGFIENIKVIGHLKGNPAELKFENAYPLAFTTRKDYRRLQDIYIYERTIYAYKRDSDSSCRFKLGDLLFYNQNLQLNTKDYSPVNHVLQQKITDSLTYLNLNKELTSKILEMKVFSDLKGIEGGEPNGLVQFEVSKKLNFLTMRWPISTQTAKVNIGLFNYFTPMFTMNKIENNSKRLTPYYMGTNYPDTNKANVFASTLDLFQRQVFTVGGNLTVLTVDIPGLKSTVNFGTGFSWGRVLIEDTLRTKVDSSQFTAIKDNNINQFGVNSIQFAPEVSWQIFPDKRYGVTLSQRLIYYRLQSSAIKQVKDSSDYQSYLKGLNGNRNIINDYSYKKWLGTTEIYGFYAPSEFNKVFFRYRFNWDLGNIKNNFHQLQIGISTFLTHTKKKEEKK